jgi:hypothetical protein
MEVHLKIGILVYVQLEYSRSVIDKVELSLELPRIFNCDINGVVICHHFSGT